MSNKAIAVWNLIWADNFLLLTDSQMNSRYPKNLKTTDIIKSISESIAEVVEKQKAKETVA